MHGPEQQNAQECESSCDGMPGVGATYDTQREVCSENCNRMDELTALNPGSTSFDRLLQSVITLSA